MLLIQRIYKSAAQTLKVFENKSEMDDHIAAHRLAAGRRLHKNAREVLDIIVRHSVVIPGVCWLSTDTLAKKLDICERTIRNIFARLESLGIGQRKVIEWNGMELRFFVLNRFELLEELTENFPEAYTEVSAGFSTHESDENADVSTDAAAFSGAEAIETPELKETNKDDDDLETVFNRMADEEKLPAAERKAVLERIKKYAATIGDIVAYVKSAIKRAVVGCRRAYNASRKRSTGKVPSESHIGAHSASHAFQQTIAADFARKKAKEKRVAPVPAEIVSHAEESKRMYERVEAERKAQKDARSSEEKLARVKALLVQMSEGAQTK